MTGTARGLWALDGGRLTLERAELLDGAAPGPLTIPAPSFLVEHEAGRVLVDTGLDPAAATDPDVYAGLGVPIAFTPEQTVDAQLEALGLAVADVTHVVLTHVHFDHTGGLPLFSHARCVLGVGDRPSVDGTDPIGIAREADIAPARGFDWTFAEGDHDLFGDGAVVVLAMPGHTPGNTSVLVRLPDRVFLLSGDTAHLRAALDRPAPMAADTDPVAAVASLHRLNALAAEHDAQVWVAHDPDDWARYGAPGRIA